MKTRQQSQSDWLSAVKRFEAIKNSPRCSTGVTSKTIQGLWLNCAFEAGQAISTEPDPQLHFESVFDAAIRGYLASMNCPTPTMAGVQLATSLVCNLVRMKNADYGDSALQGAILADHLGVVDGLLCRMSDKIRRIENLLLSTDSMVVDESLSDSWKDLAGYALLGIVALIEVPNG